MYVEYLAQLKATTMVYLYKYDLYRKQEHVRGIYLLYCDYKCRVRCIERC